MAALYFWDLTFFQTAYVRQKIFYKKRLPTLISREPSESYDLHLKSLRHPVTGCRLFQVARLARKLKNKQERYFLAFLREWGKLFTLWHGEIGARVDGFVIIPDEPGDVPSREEVPLDGEQELHRMDRSCLIPNTDPAGSAVTFTLAGLEPPPGDREGELITFDPARYVSHCGDRAAAAGECHMVC